MPTETRTGADSKWAVWTGRIVSGLLVLFLIFDGVTKVIKERHVLEASAQLGYPVDRIVATGAILLVCVAAYVIPRTSILGAILLTGYLGGAIATQLRAHNPAFETAFPFIFGVLAWGALYLREHRLRALIPLRG
ncbi:MAG TPA: DoxX family protein [Candidatus Acidoferrales bacterium]|nr:DoxX family protein [Candidatus Acidoferrales bacterium]